MIMEKRQILCIVCYIIFQIEYCSNSEMTVYHDKTSLLSLHFPLREMFECTENNNNRDLAGTLKFTVNCVIGQQSHCDFKSQYHNVQAGNIYLPIRVTYCGYILVFAGKHMPDYHLIKVHAYPGYMIALDFMEFRFDWSGESCIRHGITLTDYRKKNNFTYCGRRIPWKLLMNNIILIKTKIISQLTHKLNLFYTANRIEWLGNRGEIRYLYGNQATIPFTDHKTGGNRDGNLRVGNYYIISDPGRQILMTIKWRPSHKVSLKIHDGPGEMADQIIILNNQTPPDIYMSKTAAFVSFLSLSQPILYDAQYIGIITYVSQDHHDTKPCVSLSKARDRLVIESSQTTNIICSFTLMRDSAWIFVYDFQFRGPSFLTYESPNKCHFGGFFVVSNDETSALCGVLPSQFQFNVAGPRIDMLVIWYGSYTEGYVSFAPETQTDDCRRSFPHKGSRDTFSVDTSIFCQFMVCTHLPKYPHFCDIFMKGDKEDIGVARIKLNTYLSITSCLFDPNKDSNVGANVSLIFNNNWPLGRKSVFDGKSILVKNFDPTYIYSGNISISYDCSEHGTIEGMYVYFTISQCELKGRKVDVQPTSHTIPVSSACVGIMRRLIKMRTTSEPARLLYKGVNNIQQMPYIKLEYAWCPMVCKTIDYKIFVSRLYESSVYEYRSKMGQYIFSGYFHQGFMVEIYPPNDKCPRNTTCIVAISVDVQQFVHGLHNRRVWHFGSKSLYVFEIRYEHANLRNSSCK